MLAVAGAVVAMAPAATPPTIPALGSALIAAGDSCDSVLKRTQVGWVDQEYHGSLRQWDGEIDFPKTHLLMALNEIGANLRLDRPLDLTTLGTQRPQGTFNDAPDQNLSTFDTQGLYGFHYEASGKLKDARVLVSSLSPRLDSAILRAVQMVSDSGTLLPLPETVRRTIVELRLTIGANVLPDSLAVISPLFRIHQPVFHGVTPPAGDTQMTIAPRYPDAERKAGMNGEVVVQVVVRPDGSVDPSSILITRATTHSFAQHVYDAVRQSKFVPGRIAGCPVTALVAWPIAFTMR
jgi:TonB family protein